MKSLYSFICEEEEKKGEVLQELDDALEYFEEDECLKKAGFTREMIEYLYTYAKEHSLKSPFVKDYEGKKGFVVRRWVNDTPEINQYLSNNGFDPGKNIKGIYKGPHNTSLEKINEFPNSTQYEYFIAMSLNIKSLGKNKVEDALKYAMFGEKQKLNSKEQELFKKYMNYYNDHKSEINELSEGYDVEDGELFEKLPNSSTKSHISDNWTENGQYDRYPNYTPKTDIISNMGRQISVKNGNGSQAMSGGENEARATLMSYKHLLDKDTQKDIDSLFESNWKGRDKDRNTKLSTIIKNIFKDKEKNKKFIIAILAESITGAGKFEKNSEGVATEMCSWSNGKLIKDDIDTYIYRVFEKITADDIAINHKSSGSTWAVLRIYLPSHHKRFNELTAEEKNDDVFKIIEGVKNRDIINKKNLKNYGIDDNDDDDKNEEDVKELGKDEDGNKYTIRDKERGPGKTCDVDTPDGKHYNITADEAHEKLNEK